MFGCGAHEIVLFSWAPQWCVLGGVLLSRTLAGAVPSALSGLASGFGMGAGRFPVAVTTETTGWAVRDNPSWLSSSFGTLFDCLCLVAVAFDAYCVWLVGGLGVDRIVDARVYSLLHPPGLLPVCGVCLGGVVVCVGRISTSQLPTVAGLPLLAYQPSSLLGAYQSTAVPCGDLVLKMVSRLDAFSGYPSRT